MASKLTKPEFPRSSGYDADWVLDGNMGPNPLWLAEWLTAEMKLDPGMRVLDLGCGMALSSVFLAREFDTRVVAADLWTSVHDNWQRVVAAGEADRVTPVQTEAHALPFAQGYFDAVVSIDAYGYFGTDQLYLSYLSRFVRPGGVIGVVTPGLTQPLPNGQVPAHLSEPQSNGKVFWESDCAIFHTADWWRELFCACPHVEVLVADTQPDGWRHWLDHERAAEAAGKSPFPSDAEALAKDAGDTIGFVRVIARRTETTGMNLYDPDLVAKVKAGLA